MKFTNCLHVLLAGLLLLTGCDDDDTSRSDCPKPSDLKGCVALSDLSVEEHFTMLVGEWKILSGGGGMVSGSDFCGNDLTGENFIRYNADSTFVQSEFGEVSNGHWQVIRDTLTSGQVRQFVMIDDGGYFQGIQFICNDGLAYYDYTPIDGVFRVYERED